MAAWERSTAKYCPRSKTVNELESPSTGFLATVAETTEPIRPLLSNSTDTCMAYYSFCLIMTCNRLHSWWCPSVNSFNFTIFRQFPCMYQFLVHGQSALLSLGQHQDIEGHHRPVIAHSPAALHAATGRGSIVHWFKIRPECHLFSELTKQTTPWPTTCITTHQIEKELLFCQSYWCPGLTR